MFFDRTFFVFSQTNRPKNERLRCVANRAKPDVVCEKLTGQIVEGGARKRGRPKRCRRKKRNYGYSCAVKVCGRSGENANDVCERGNQNRFVKSIRQSDKLVFERPDETFTAPPMTVDGRGQIQNRLLRPTPRPS